MAHKELKFSEDARRSLERGVNVVADAVRVTSATEQPIRAEANAASHPACPAPTTITS